MADARRIIFGTYVVPQEGKAAEEAIPSKYILLQEDTGNNTVAKTLGGKGEVTTAQIQANQWSDGWTSMFHQQAYWEDQDEQWELSMDYWDGTSAIGTTAVRLSGGNTNATNKDLAFVYVKNLGSTYNVYLSCTAGGTSGYNIVIPPGGSVQFRGGGTHCDDIYAKCDTGESSTIEYILAKSEA